MHSSSALTESRLVAEGAEESEPQEEDWTVVTEEEALKEQQKEVPLSEEKTLYSVSCELVTPMQVHLAMRLAAAAVLTQAAAAGHTRHV